MGGFTSTSRDYLESVNYALKNHDSNNLPVLMHVQWRESERYGAFRMDSKLYSAMPQEKEVLIVDGCWFKIIDVIKNF